MERGKPVRAKRVDVARIAGVSVATVSYVLNGTKKVSPEVEKRVLEASEILNYTPNRIAQSLAGNRTHTIAFITDDITNLYQLEVIKGLQAEALKHDYIVYICDASGDIAKYIDHIISRRVDGVFVVTAPNVLPDEKLLELRNSGTKVLADFARSTYLPDVSYIMSDMYGGFEQSVRYLCELGHEKIGYLSAFDEACYYDMRLAAFKIAMRKVLGVTVPYIECGCEPYRTSSEVGADLMQAMLKNHPDVTAVLCTNDLMAIGAMLEASHRGLRVPEDISVIGLDNIRQSETCTPRLTTLSQCGKEYGQRVFDILHDDIVHGGSGKFLIPMKLIERDSVAPPRPPANAEMYT